MNVGVDYGMVFIYARACECVYLNVEHVWTCMGPEIGTGFPTTSVLLTAL